MANSRPISLVPCFRRWYSDGDAVAKMELGLASAPQSLGHLTPQQFNGLLSRVCGTRISVPVAISGITQVEIAEAGQPLARQFLHASTKAAALRADAVSRWTQQGAPLLFVEVRQTETIDVSQPVFSRELPEMGVVLQHFWFRHKSKSLRVWLMQVTGERDKRRARDLRVCLMRLHAEQEVLQCVLRAIVRGEVRPERSSSSSNRLQAYLNRSTRWLHRASSRVDNDIFEQALETNNKALPGQATSIGEALRVQMDIRPQLAKKIDALWPRELGGPIFLAENIEFNKEVDMSQDTINVRDVVGPVNIKSRLDHVIQQVNNVAPTFENGQLRKLLETLRTQLASLPADRQEDAERVAQATEPIVGELAKKKPNKGFLNVSVEGLKEAAKAVADIAPFVLATATEIAAWVARVLG